MGGCFRFFVGLFCTMLALEVLAELFSWTDVPFDALLLPAATVYGGSFAVRAYLRAFKGARTGKRSS